MASSKKSASAGHRATKGDDDIEDAINALFTKPLGEFTQARDELAKRLRGAGDRDAAARVKAMKRPSVSVWTLNQLARRYPQRVDALLVASERLREAQRGALEEGGAKGLREASQAHRASVNELLRTAPALLSEGGHSAGGQNLDRVRDSLLATPTARREDLEHFERGVLVREIEPGDIADVLGMMRGRPAPPKEPEKHVAAEVSERREEKAKVSAPKREEKTKRAERGREAKTKAGRRGEKTKHDAQQQREEKKRLSAQRREEEKRLNAERRDEKKRLSAQQREEKKRLNAERRELTQATAEAARTMRESERRKKDADQLARAAEKAMEAAKAAAERAERAKEAAAEAERRAVEGARRLEVLKRKLDASGT